MLLSVGCASRDLPVHHAVMYDSLFNALADASADDVAVANDRLLLLEDIVLAEAEQQLDQKQRVSRQLGGGEARGVRCGGSRTGSLFGEAK